MPMFEPLKPFAIVNFSVRPSVNTFSMSFATLKRPEVRIPSGIELETST
jgi:hypothetical protein